jgi:glycosyltransferase involved in cell wall biosynthesis
MVKTIVYTVHSIASKDGGKISRILNKHYFKKLGVIPVALSEIVKQTIALEYKISEDKVPVVYNGINLKNLKVKQSYLNNGEFTFLHVGRFEKEKNHIGLLKAFKIFNEKYINSKLQLIGDGSERNAIEEFIKTNNLSLKVELLGLKDNVYDYLYNADGFVLPSLFEGIPMTLIEAMGTGLPIIATSVGGVPNMIKNNESGILTSLDENEIAQAMEKVYKDIEFRSKIGKNAIKDSERFSSKNMALSYVEIYSRGI